MPSYIRQLGSLDARITKYVEESETEDGFKDGFEDGFYALLTSVVDVVRRAEGSGAVDLPAIANVAGNILNSAIEWAYSDGDFDFLKSFAHSNTTPLVESNVRKLLGHGMAKSFLAFYQRMGGGSVPQDFVDSLISPSWTTSYRPHQKSTRLSRFHIDGSVRTSATHVTPVAQTILQARCEVSSDNVACPVNSAIADDSSVLVVLGQGGWKHRDPVVSLCILDETEDNPGDQESSKTGIDYTLGRHYRTIVVEPGFSEVADQVAMDTPHKLAFVADSYRVKSFYWGKKDEASFKDWAPERGTNVHTMNCDNHSGPIVMLPGGRLARAGKGSFAVWDVDKLATHEGGKRVGKGEFDVENSWRDNEGDEIETSTGSKPTTTIKVADEIKDLMPFTLALHGPSGHVLVGENGRKSPARFGCYTVDLENGGKKVSRYIGHGGFVETFSISSGDPHLFATGGSDGYARLYDVRHPTPVITLDSGGSEEYCGAVQFIHPDGIPVVFTGGALSQSIKTWDIRARAMVHELSTGNNAVRALSWDAKRKVLYAATECESMDRMGYHHDYRRAHIPKWARLTVQEGGADDEDEDMDENDDDIDEDDYDSVENWPKNAYHFEESFGYAYDAGDHALLRYEFKEDPDMAELPVYGQATLERDDSYW